MGKLKCQACDKILNIKILPGYFSFWDAGYSHRICMECKEKTRDEVIELISRHYTNESNRKSN